MEIKEKIISKLKERFAPVHLKLSDESFKHARHPQARKHGGGHYRLLIVAQEFCGMSKVQKHRIIYATLHEFMPAEIHALSIQALTPEEFSGEN